MNKYTVILMRPDYIADVFGQDSYIAHVEANSPENAVEAAQREAAEVDNVDNEDYADYFPTAVFPGHLKSFT